VGSALAALWHGVINTRFFNNVCADDGPDVGGAGVRARNVCAVVRVSGS
jgi:hypothetical protein